MMSVEYGTFQLRQQLQASLCNPRQDHPAILGVAAPRNQAALLEAIQKPRNIRVSGDHATGDLATSQALRRPAQDSQHVVLRRRDLGCFQHRLQPPRELVAGEHEVYEDLLLQGARAARDAVRFALSGQCDIAIIIVITNNVKGLKLM